jgi:8-hydroxy-5-deazaflavin:NADPH oxidoreductase
VIAIIGGTGNLGYGLALRWARAGEPLTIGSRVAERAKDAAGRVLAQVPGAEVGGDENGAAAAGAGVVVVTLPFATQAATLKALEPHLREGQLLIDCTVPLAVATGGRPTRTLGVWEGSAGQQAAALVAKGVRVVSALHTVSADLLEDLGHDLHEDVLICGDRRADKAEAAALVQRIPGLRAVDAGRLEMSRFVEQLTPLMIGMNVRYKARTGITVAGLPDDLWPAPSS